MRNSLEKIVKRENYHWSKIFRAELKKNSKEKFSSFWWRDYYNDLSPYVSKLMHADNLESVLEAGSGSGKATLLLDKNFRKTLLDISPAALKYARHLSHKYEVKNVNFIEGNIFSMPFGNKSFDFVWNIGVIEHYELSHIKAMIREMIRVCSKPGIVAVGFPNFYSGPILKAWLLRKVKFIPGYKLDTEKFYSFSDIEKIFKIAANESNRDISYLKNESFGNPLIMETPEFILKTIGKPLSFICRRNKFLKLMICKLE